MVLDHHEAFTKRTTGPVNLGQEQDSRMARGQGVGSLEQSLLSPGM